jgi:hypothetical protein
LAHIPPPLPALSRRTSSPHAVKPLYTARHPPGSGPVTGRPVTSRLAWADSDTGGGPFCSGLLGSVPGSIPARLRLTQITGGTLGPGRLGSQRPVASHDADHSGPTGLGPCPSREPARFDSTDANGIMSQDVDQHSRCGVRGCYYAKNHLDLLASPAPPARMDSSRA